LDNRILIIGASVRSAAASARRAGWDPVGVDLFADQDTRRICECWKCPIDEYPDGLFQLARTLPPMPFLYTGGLENFPELVGELAAYHELRGNGPDVLRRVRDPFTLRDILATRGISYPTLLPIGAEYDKDRDWLVKPYRGSAGHGIRPAEKNEPSSLASTHFLQERISGRSMSVVFHGGQHLGTSIQLVGQSWVHAEPFQYSGSISTTASPQLDLSEMVQAGILLGTQEHVQGIYNIDFVHMVERSVVIEVNPRYSASVEVLEHAQKRSFLAGEVSTSPPVPTSTIGKAVYYSPKRLVIPESGPWDDSLRHADDVWRRPDYADIPHPGDVVDPGIPVIAFFCEAENEASCLSILQQRARELDHLFGVST
jgi:uncharacterized protein